MTSASSSEESVESVEVEELGGNGNPVALAKEESEKWEEFAKFTISSDEWEKVKISSDTRFCKLKGAWTKLLNRNIEKLSKCKLSKVTYNHCSIKNEKNQPYNISKAKCKFQKCRTFKFEIKDQPTSDTAVQVEVCVQGSENHKESIIKRGIRSTTFSFV